MSMATNSLNALKKTVNKAYFYYQNKTMLLIDKFIQMIDLKLTLTVLALALLSLGLTDLIVQNTVRNETFGQEYISYYSMQDTRVQLLFYYVFCVVIFFFFLLFGLISPQSFSKRYLPNWYLSKAIFPWLIPGLALAFWLIIFLTYKQKGFNFVLAFAVAYLMKEALNGKFSSRSLALAFLSGCVIFFILPMWFDPSIPDYRLWIMDTHWTAVLGQALFSPAFEGQAFKAFAGYGIFLNGLIIQAQNFLELETLRNTHRVLSAMNILFFAMVFSVIICRLGMKDRTLVWATALLILVLFSVQMSGISRSFLTPNQLPIRFISIPIIVILSYFLAKVRVDFGAFVFGIVAPLTIFYNFETGLYCIVAMGFAFFLAGAKEGFLSFVLTGAAILFGALISASLLILLVFDGSFQSVITELVNISYSKMRSGSNGYAALPVYFFIPFILVMTHTVALFSRYLLSIKNGEKFSPTEFQSVVIVGLIIAMGTYQLNRFYVPKMWLPILLYFLLVLPNLAKDRGNNRVLWSFYLIVLIAPFIFGNPVKKLFSEKFSVAVSDRMNNKLMPCLDGLLASPELCEYSLEKANELKLLNSRYSDLKWISSLTLTMSRLTGLNTALSEKSLFFFAYNKENRDIVLKEIRQLEAPIFVIDKVISRNIAGIPDTVEKFQTNLIQDAGYQIRSESKYWIIAQKVNR